MSFENRGSWLLAGLLIVAAGAARVVDLQTKSVASAERAVTATQPPREEGIEPKWAGFERLIGSPARGRQLFLDSPAIDCRSCHSLEPGEENVGPSLAGIGSRQDWDGIVESINRPSARIAAPYPNYAVLTADGLLHEGRLETESSEFVIMRLESTTEIKIPRDQIELTRPVESRMPRDAASKLSAQELADLVAFLSTLCEEITATNLADQ